MTAILTATKPRCRTASASPLHHHGRCEAWRVLQPTARANVSGWGSVRRHSHALGCGSSHTGGMHMAGLADRHSIHSPGGLRMSETCKRGNTCGALRLGRSIQLRPQRFCTHLRRCGCRTWSEIIELILETQLLPQHVVAAMITSSPEAQILGLRLLLGLTRPETADGAALSTCCLNVRVSLAWTALWQ